MFKNSSIAALLMLIVGCGEKPEPISTKSTFTPPPAEKSDEDQIRSLVDDYLGSLRDKTISGDKFRSSESNGGRPFFPNALRKWQILNVKHKKEKDDIYGNPADAAGQVSVLLDYSDADGHPLSNTASIWVRHHDYMWKIYHVTGKN